jgi:hypothetical protein
MFYVPVFILLWYERKATLVFQSADMKVAVRQKVNTILTIELIITGFICNVKLFR